MYPPKPIKTEERLCTARTEPLMFADGVAVYRVIPFNYTVCVDPNEHQTGIERSSFPCCRSFRCNY